MFSGMPAYQINDGADANALTYVEQAQQLFIDQPIGFFIWAMIGFYILFLVLGVNPWLSIVGSVAFTLMTNNVGLFAGSDSSEIKVLFSIAPVIAGVILIYRDKYLLGGGLFAAALGVNLLANNFQLTYYFMLLLGLYVLFVLVGAMKSGEYARFVKATGVLILSGVIALASASHSIFSALDYLPESTSGEAVIDYGDDGEVADSLAWAAISSWSYGGADLMGVLIPRAAGGSATETVGEDSEFYQDFAKRNIRLGNNFSVPLYHGSLPGASGPPYMGAVMLFLFILGLMIVKGRMKWWLASVVVLMGILSLGDNLAFINHVLFDFFPYFDQQRAPSSMLTIASLFVPILAILALSEAFKSRLPKKKLKQGIIVSLAITGGACVIFAALGGYILNFDGPNDSSYQSIGYNLDALKADRLKYMRSDAIRSLILILLAAAALWGFYKKKLTSALAIGFFAFIIILDLWGIDKRYLSDDHFASKGDYEKMFEMSDMDKLILRDDDPHYRVHDLTADPWNNASMSNFHKTLGGNHPNKLQRYVDVMDYYLYDGKQTVLNMLNVKYFVLPNEDGTKRIHQNRQAYGNAWFVEGINTAKDAKEELGALDYLDLKSMAVVHEEFTEEVKGLDPSKNGYIKLTSYSPDTLRYESNSLSDQLAVFSEVWYGPDKGWKITIDGDPAKLIRANYVLRAVNVPEGKHVIEMTYSAPNYQLGMSLSSIMSILIVLGFIGILAREFQLQLPKWNAEFKEQADKLKSGKRKKK